MSFSAIVQSASLSNIDPLVQGTIITGIFGMMIAGLGIIAEGFRRHQKQLSGIKDQVTNSHSTNLRDDLDQVMNAVTAVLFNQARDEQTLRDQSDQLMELGHRIDQERIERQTVAKIVDHLVPAIEKKQKKK